MWNIHLEGAYIMLKVDKVARLFKRSVEKLRVNSLLREIGVNWKGLHCIFQDDRGNTHVVKGLHIKETGDIQLWYAGANTTEHLIQTPFTSVKRLVQLVTKIYAQERKD